MDPLLYRQLLQEMRDREKIEWFDQPQPGRYARGALRSLLFAIPWTTGAVLWMAGAAGFALPDFNEGADFLPLLGLPFVVVGFVLLTQPLRDYLTARRLVYVISNQRAMVVRFGRNRVVTGYGPEEIGEIERVEWSDGCGNLSFRLIRDGRRGGGGSPKTVFRAVRQVRGAEAHLRSLKARAGA